MAVLYVGGGIVIVAGVAALLLRGALVGHVAQWNHNARLGFSEWRAVRRRRRIHVLPRPVRRSAPGQLRRSGPTGTHGRLR